jgi:putative MATE family efflux protein
MEKKERSVGMAATRDLTKGRPFSVIITFALTMLLSQLFQQLYNTADTLIVGQFLGTEALAAVSASGSLIFLMVSFFEGLAMGAGVLISRYYGANEPDNVNRAVHTDLAMGLLCGTVLTVVGVAFTPTLLRWMQVDPEVMPQAIEYFRYYFLGGLALVMYNTCRGIMTALGDSKRPLYYLIFSSLLNIALDLLFVAGFGWGVWSAALATVISQAASVLLCLVHMCKKDQVFTVQWQKLRLHRDMLRQILRYGLPSAVQNSVIAIANVIVQSHVNLYGKMATAASGVHSKIEGFAFLPITAFNMAVTTFVSQNLGARQYERAKSGARIGILTAVVLAELVGVVVFFGSEWLVGIFDATPEVLAYGRMIHNIVPLFYCLLAFAHSVAAVCRGAGKAFVPMFIMLAIWCVLRIAYIITVTHFFHRFDLVYWAYPLTWFVSSIIYLIYFLKSDWVHGLDKH